MSGRATKRHRREVQHQADIRPFTFVDTAHWLTFRAEQAAGEAEEWLEMTLPSEWMPEKLAHFFGG